MKAIMISIKPRFVADILNGKKTLEIRKKFPSDYVGWVYIYCTKENDLFKSYIRMGYYTTRSTADDLEYNGKGKVVARFWCDKVEKLHCNSYGLETSEHWYRTTTMHERELLNKCALTFEELDDYLSFKNGYAIHITKLEIFDKPKELSEFKVIDYFIEQPRINGWVKQEIYKQLTKAPQSWCYIEV